MAPASTRTSARRRHQEARRRHPRFAPTPIRRQGGEPSRTLRFRSHPLNRPRPSHRTPRLPTRRRRHRTPLAFRLGEQLRLLPTLAPSRRLRVVELQCHARPTARSLGARRRSIVLKPRPVIRMDGRATSLITSNRSRVGEQTHRRTCNGSRWRRRRQRTRSNASVVDECVYDECDIEPKAAHVRAHANRYRQP